MFSLIIRLAYIISTLCIYSSVFANSLLNITGQTMGTYYRISVAYDQDINIKALRDAIEFKLEALNAALSTYIDDSEISRFNQSTSIEYQVTSPDIVNVVKVALEIYQQTQGQFDITIGPLVNLWSFGPEQRVLKSPEKLLIKQKKAITGSDLLTVDIDHTLIKKSIPQLQLDLSAIAKGYAVDQIYKLLKQNSYQNFLVDIGGELRASGEKSEQVSWRVGIEQARSDSNHSIQQVIEMQGKSIATSGSYRNYFEQDGVRYSHIINPKTGSPVTHKLVSVSVISDDCMLADAYATALLVLGPDKGYDFALQYELAVYMIVKQGEGFEIKLTPEMQAYLVSE